MAAGNLIPCPDCGHMLSRLAESCPSCARPLRASGPREGLFLRTMNQAVAAMFWVPVFPPARPYRDRRGRVLSRLLRSAPLAAASEDLRTFLKAV